MLYFSSEPLGTQYIQIVCFVSCRLLDRPRLHQTLHQIIRKDAFLAMTEGRRRIETVQVSNEFI